MNRTPIHGGSKPVGPYSPGLRIGSTLFVSGQIPIDESGNLVSGDIASETRQAMGNLSRVLEAAGFSLRDLAKITIFLTDMRLYPDVNEVYASLVEEPYPARSVVEVSALPKGANIEIEAIAVVP